MAGDRELAGRQRRTLASGGTQLNHMCLQGLQGTRELGCQHVWLGLLSTWTVAGSGERLSNHQAVKSPVPKPQSWFHWVWLLPEALPGQLAHPALCPAAT